jgi:hypothetical protein
LTVGLAGILVGLAILVALAFRGWDDRLAGQAASERAINKRRSERAAC